jgi:hypothetical protein
MIETHIGFTGTQQEPPRAQRELLGRVLRTLTDRCSPLVLHHGDCIGSDALAHRLALELGIEVEIHPPINSSKRAFCKGARVVYAPKDYIPRNHDIVDLSTRLISLPKGKVEELRSGTWATIRYARKQRKQTLYLYPDGTMGMGA